MAALNVTKTVQQETTVDVHPFKPRHVWICVCGHTRCVAATEQQAILLFAGLYGSNTTVLFQVMHRQTGGSLAKVVSSDA